MQSVGGDNLIPVYVSAVCTPEQFWIQVRHKMTCGVLLLLTISRYRPRKPKNTMN